MKKKYLELKSQGMTLREIGEKFGFTYKQAYNFITRYNKKQRMIEAVQAIHRKGKTCENQDGSSPSLSRRGNPYDNALAGNSFSILKTECIHRVKLATYEEDILHHR